MKQQAYIRVKEAHCKNCYKCLKHCQVKSISYTEEHVSVLADQCILCGQCLNVCPQNAKTVVNDPTRILSWLKDDSTRVVASLAPSYIGLYGAENRGRLYSALQQLGFDAVEETAVGAHAVTEAYRRLLDEGTMPSLLTTCCPTVNTLVTKYFPALTPYLAPVVSPVLAHGRHIKQRDGADTRVVFIGPCLSKMKEIDEHPESVDGALSFRQLETWLQEYAPLERQPDTASLPPPVQPQPFSRIYPVPEGILRDVEREHPQADGGRNGYHFLSVCGLDNVMAFLRELSSGRCSGVFAELNACDGGCVNGPLIPEERRATYSARVHVERFAADNARPVPPVTVDLSLTFLPESPAVDEPDEQTIRRILTEIGKPTPDKELNCGSCGYSTCRDKAIAVYQKKAELHMCLPYMTDLAQSLSSVTLSVTPNYIVAVDRELRVMEINLAAQKFFGVSRQKALKSDLFTLLDPADFQQVLTTGANIIDKKLTLGDPSAIVLETLVYVKEQDIAIGFFKDVTDEERRREELHQARLQSAEMAQRVIEKQMIVAQEIASLLGETTAETKVTLNNLKNQILQETD